ncbi:MAG: OmpA family protein [Myxococcota bacterium]
MSTFVVSRRTLLVVSALASSTAVAPALAGAPGADLGISLVSTVSGDKQPALIFKPKYDVKRVHILLTRSDGKKRSMTIKAMVAGRQRRVPVPQGYGSYAYGAAFEVAYQNGETEKFTMKFEFTRSKKLSLDLDPKNVDLDQRSMHFTLSNPAQKAELVLVDKDGKKVHTERVQFNGAKPGSKLRVSWADPGVELLYMDLLVYDTSSFWKGVRLTPVSISIPHEDVEFATGKWDIRPREEPKLDKALGELKKAMAKLQRAKVVLPLRLYVAGYTDTVGDKGSNLILSRNRARSIAAWFARRRAGLPIFYQGFGEEGLAVGTPDETEEQRNRRALYVLATQTPAKSGSFPRQTWSKL